MAQKEFEEDDPMELAGMVVPLDGEKGRQAEESMIGCFIEEYLMLGYDQEKIVELFRDPFYQATHAVYLTRGENHIRQMIEKVCRGES